MYIWVTRCLGCPLHVLAPEEDPTEFFCGHPKCEVPKRELPLARLSKEHMFPRWCPLKKEEVSVTIAVPTQLKYSERFAPKRDYNTLKRVRTLK